MFTFDFQNSGFPAFRTTPPGGTLTNTADGVTFSLSGDVAGGREALVFGNGGGTGFSISDQSTPDQITLAFQSVAYPANTRINGNSGTPIQFQWGNVRGTWQIAFNTAGAGTVTPTGADASITNMEDNGTLSFVGTGITGIVFTSTAGATSARLVGNSLSGSEFNCFFTGTQISTPVGSVSVETLSPGDLVRTADGRAVTVRWLGEQFVDTRVVHPAKVNPICITAGALAEGVPERDLYVSPDHAIELDGYLINAGALVNGESIYQVRTMPQDGFTYYHIETEAHELLLAEGCPAESFLDYSDTFGFDNSDEREERVIPEMDLPRIASQRLLPAGIKNRMVSRKALRAA